MQSASFTLSANLIDVLNRRTFLAELEITDGRISRVTHLPPDTPLAADAGYLLPGFVDSHVHIESSMLTPTQFGRMAAVHGTVATVSDPHEIANVCGLDGIRFMQRDARNSPIKTFFGAPSCVPATTFETAGATIDLPELTELFAPTTDDEPLLYLAEMMNYPGVIYQDPAVMARIQLAHDMGRKVDGHAPGLRGEPLKAYLAAGITTDHECFTLEEATEKADLGVKILIREGSAARNYEALHPLFKTHAAQLMFCSDDKHPDDLLVGHINLLVKRSLALGYDLYDVLHAACVAPVQHYGLPVGLLQPGDAADFILVDNLKHFNVRKTWVGGRLVAADGKPMLSEKEARTTATTIPNSFALLGIEAADLVCKTTTTSWTALVRAIVAHEGQLVTSAEMVHVPVHNGQLLADLEQDLCYITVVNRYQQDAKPAIGFIKGFGLKTGALASTVAHDSHNIVAVGTSTEALAQAINLVCQHEGGVAAWSPNRAEILPLPLAGLMSLDSAEVVGHAYQAVDALAKDMGSTLKAPFMTLSFMALLVIPSLKMSDLGLFDGEDFKFVPLEIAR